MSATREILIRALAPAALALPLAFVAPLGAQGPALVRDIGDAQLLTYEQYFGGRPAAAVAGGTGYFQFDDGIHGREFWASDGTTAGTRLVVDLCPGVCGAQVIGSRRGIAALGDRVVFAGDDGVHGEELWISDGTAAGTLLVADIAPGLRSGRPDYFVAAANQVFFAADDGPTGAELWRTDGTAPGTWRVADLRPGPPGAGVLAATALGDRVLFTPFAPGGLWISDGTPAGTFPVTFDVALPQGLEFANPPAAVLDGRLLFRSEESIGGTLWTSDGTAAGTYEVAAIEDAWLFTAGDGVVFFLTAPPSPRRLYRTDGTALGTVEIPLPAGVEPTTLRGLIAYSNGLLFFAAEDATHGREPWASDGVSAWRVEDIRPGPEPSLDLSDPLLFYLGATPFFAPVAGGIVLLADDGVHGQEPWASDGTAAGTELLVELAAGGAGTEPGFWQSWLPPIRLDSTVLFRVRDAERRHLLARSDGTAAGTSVIALLDGQTSAFLPRASELGLYANPPLDLCWGPLGAGAVFRALDAATGDEPWFSDGTPGGTWRIADVSPGPPGSAGETGPENCRPIAGRAVFHQLALDTFDAWLYSTGGAAGDIETLAGPMAYPPYPNAVALFDGDLWYSGEGLWRTDGTAAGTSDLEPGAGVGGFSATAHGDSLYLGSGQLYRTDGTPGGLVAVAPSPDGPQDINRLTPVGASLLFLGSTSDHGTELWTSDGTAAGTLLVRDLRLGPGSAFFEDAPSAHREGLTRLVALGTRAVFAADDGLHGEELWVTDGTFAGTLLLADLYPGTYPSSPRELARVGDWVYFVAELPGAGRELLRTNGVPGGTQLVADLVAGAGSSLPQQLTAAGSELYFSAWTPGAGREPWRLRDGAPPAPLLAPLAEIAPGPLSSSPLAFLEVGGAVLLAANDNTLGFELWTVRESDSVFSDGFESSGTAVWSIAAP